MCLINGHTQDGTARHPQPPPPSSRAGVTGRGAARPLLGMGGVLWLAVVSLLIKAMSMPGIDGE